MHVRLSSDVVSDLRRLLVRLENAQSQAERCADEVEAQAKERGITVDRNAGIAGVLKVLVDATAADLRELIADIEEAATVAS